MTNEKLSEVIKEENERLERAAVAEAQHHIRAIGQLKASITQAHADIAEHQAALKKLQITQIDPVSILGA